MSPSPLRAAAWLAKAALLLTALTGAGCGDDVTGEAPEPEDRVIVKLSFDDFAYVDAGVPTRKLIERVRQENESIFSALRRADVMITAKKLVDVDLGHLEKDPVTVVDLQSGITRSALRLRYHFVALALAPKELVKKGDLRLAALHNPGPGVIDAVLANCTANGDKERAASAEPWTVFDGRIDRCIAAVSAEQAAIDAARKKLTQPAREIVSAEFERVLVPVMVRIRERNKQGEEPAPNKPTEGAWAEGEVAWRWVDKAAERDFGDAEDERTLQRMARPAGGGLGADGNVRSWSVNTYLAPNFTLLYVVIGALVLLAIGWRRQEQNKRR